DVHRTADGRSLLVTHGDEFDLVVKHARVLSVLGGWAYERLIGVNARYNWVRRQFGLPYWSLSQYVKQRVKSACEYVSRFESGRLEEARRRGLDGVVGGHIHKAEARRGEGDAMGLMYYNCGDWMESCTALVEHEDGSMRVIDGLALVEQLAALSAPEEPDAEG